MLPFLYLTLSSDLPRGSAAPEMRECLIFDTRAGLRLRRSPSSARRSRAPAP